jgi:hypothetical protein
MNNEQPTTIRVMATSRGWMLAGTLLVSVAVACAAYGLNIAGLGELAATGGAFFLLTLGRMLLPGMLTGTAEVAAFQGTAKIVRTFTEDYERWIAARPLPARAGVALALTVAFLILRLVVNSALGLLANIWIAAAAGALVAALVCAPELLTALSDRVKPTSRHTAYGDTDTTTGATA